MIEFLDPRAEPGTPPEPYELSIDIEAGPAELGLVANGFPDSMAFLEAVGAALQQRVPGLRLRYYDKGNASVVASDDLVEGISKECQAVITAYGH